MPRKNGQQQSKNILKKREQCDKEHFLQTLSIEKDKKDKRQKYPQQKKEQAGSFFCRKKKFSYA